MTQSHNRIHAFIGPTISQQEAHALRPDIVFHPPIQCGDLFFLLPDKPAGIIIIDGFFEQTASIWHKEILHTLSLNIPILGASSMGALRAAELHRFGMQGIGDIFNAYLSGELTDDDEVAVSHYPQELNYQPNSDAMINIRRTLALATQQSMINQAQHDALIDSAKHTFYPQRSLINCIQTSALPKTQQHSLQQWLQHNEINQKKQDAIQALTVTSWPTAPNTLKSNSTIQSYNLFKIAQQARCKLISHEIFFQQLTTLLLANHLLTAPNSRCRHPIRQAYHEMVTQIINRTPINASSTLALQTDLVKHHADYQAFADTTHALYLYPTLSSDNATHYDALRQQLWVAIKDEFQLKASTTNPHHLEQYAAQFYRQKQIHSEQDFNDLSEALSLNNNDITEHLNDQSLYKHYLIDSRLSPRHWDATATMHDWASITKSVADHIKQRCMA